MLLKQIGTDMGDKHFHGIIPNMKQGEYRYYPQDNPNLKFALDKKVKRKDFIILLKEYFPKYIINPEGYEEEDEGYWIGSVGITNEIHGEKHYDPVVINKGYICFQEATKLKSGTVYYIHSRFVLKYEEIYKIANPLKEIKCN